MFLISHALVLKKNSSTYVKNRVLSSADFITEQNNKEIRDQGKEEERKGKERMKPKAKKKP